MPVLISRREPIHARFTAPASKPETQRAILAAALAEGSSRLEGALAARETEAMIRACRALGAEITAEAAGLRIEGVGPRLRDPRHAGQDCYIWAAGSALVARIFATLGSAIPQRVIVDGNDVLRSRPFAPLFELLGRHGVAFEHLDREHRLPCIATSQSLPGGTFRIGTSISSQFATALLVAAPLAERATVLELTGEHHSLPYILQTVDMLRRFAVPVAVGPDARTITVPAGRPYRPQTVALTGDYTSASYLMGAAYTTRGRVEIANLDPASLQGERAMVEILAGLGAEIAWTAGGALIVDCTDLPDEVEASFDLRPSPNILPTVAALAATTRGRVRITGARLTQFHKSPRIEAMAQELAKAGIAVTVLRGGDGVPDGLELRGRPASPGHVTFSSHGDHRIFMALALFALSCERACGFGDSHDTADSFPGFMADLGLAAPHREPAAAPDLPLQSAG